VPAVQQISRDEALNKDQFPASSFRELLIKEQGWTVGIARQRKVIWKSNWGSERDAKQFYDTLGEMLSRHFPSSDFSNLAQGREVGSGHFFKAQRNDRQIILSIRWPG
jgi:hypothetical protein